MTSMTASDSVLIYLIILSVPLESTVITLMDWSVLLNFTRLPGIQPHPSQVPSTLATGAADFRVKCIASATCLDLTAVRRFPLSHLINGRGREPDSNVSVALSVVNVDPMKRYRFRLINSACFAAYNFSIDGHDLTVIEIDGVETVPHTVGVVPIFAGMFSRMLIPNGYANAG